MKLPPRLIAVALMFFAQGLFAQNTVSQALAEAQRAYYGGNLELAKVKFMQVLQTDPQNPTALHFLTTIRTQESATGSAGAQAGKQFKTLVLPKVEMRDVSLADALDRLKQLVAKQSDGKLAANFVAKLPPETIDQKITLSLVNVPFTEALKYLGELADVQFSFEKYAIVVKKKAAAATAGEPAPAAQPQ
jgi:hypothetical protein